MISGFVWGQRAAAADPEAETGTTTGAGSVLLAGRLAKAWASR